MEEDDLPFAEAARGDERRAVSEARPDAHLVGEEGRIGEDLAIHRDIRRDLEAGEQARIFERCERLRRRPRQRAAKCPTAGAKADREEIVAALFQSRTGEADEHATFIDPFADARLQLAGERADVRHNDDRRLLLERAVDRAREARILLTDEFGERRECPVDVVEGGQQRLRLLAALARDEGDAMPARAAVEEMDGAGAAFACDLDARDLIAQLKRQLEAGDGLLGASAKFVRGFGETLAAGGKRERGAVTRRSLGADDRGFKLAFAVETSRHADRLVAGAAGDDLQTTAAAGEASECRCEGGRLAVVIDAVTEPDDVDAGLSGNETRELVGDLGAQRLERLRLQCRGGRARGTWGLDTQRRRLGAGGGRRDDDGTVGGFGLGDQPVDELGAGGEVAGARPTVVDDKRDRTAPREPGFAARI